MFIIENENKTLNKLEVFFPKTIFYHLTGIVAKDKKEKEYTANRFYKELINGSIDSKALYIKDNTTNLKLKILNQLIYIDKNAKMLGDFSSTKIYLRTNKVLGGVNSCMGFVKNNNYEYFIPNTILKEDIRNITINRKKIIAIFKREMYEHVYKNLTYIKKDFQINKILGNKDISKFIDLENIYSDNPNIKDIIQKFLTN